MHSEMVSVEFVYSLALKTFFQPVNVPVFLVFLLRFKKEITTLVWFLKLFWIEGKTTRTLFVCVLWHNHNSDRTNMEFIDRIQKSLSKKKKIVDKNSKILRHTENESDRECLRFYNSFAQSTTLLIAMSSTEMNSRTCHGWNLNRPHNISCFNHWLLSPSLSLIAFNSFICS